MGHLESLCIRTVGSLDRFDPQMKRVGHISLSVSMAWNQGVGHLREQRMLGPGEKETTASE